MPAPKVITLTPTALDRNGISASETLAAARLSLLIGGALTTGYDRNGICAAQTPTGADAMTLDGALGVDFADRKGIYVLIYGGDNESGRTFTVVGENANGDRITEAITGPNAGITLGTTKFYHITSITPDDATAAAVEIGVNGYAEFSTPQHVAVYSAGNDSGDTFTVYGYDRYGNEVTDSITGANAGTSTTQNQNFAWVDKVVSDGASAGAVEVGVDGKCESGWYVLNYRGSRFDANVGCALNATGNLTYALQHTFSDVLAKGFAEEDATKYTHSTITGETANVEGTIPTPPVAVRLAITAHTAGGVSATIVQVSTS